MKEKESRERDSSRSLPDPDEDSTSSSALDSRPSSAASMATGAKLKKKGKAKLTAAQVPVEPPTYEWTPILDNHDFEAAPVTCFKHVSILLIHLCCSFCYFLKLKFFGFALQ